MQYRTQKTGRLFASIKEPEYVRCFLCSALPRSALLTVPQGGCVGKRRNHVLRQSALVDAASRHTRITAPMVPLLMQLEIALFCLDRLIVVVVVEQRSWSSSVVAMRRLT